MHSGCVNLPGGQKPFTKRGEMGTALLLCIAFEKRGAKG